MEKGGRNAPLRSQQHAGKNGIADALKQVEPMIISLDNLPESNPHYNLHDL
jgi:hypothetical protein